MTMLGIIESAIIAIFIAGIVLVCRDKRMTTWVALYWITAITFFNIFAVVALLLWKYVYIPRHSSSN